MNLFYLNNHWTLKPNRLVWERPLGENSEETQGKKSPETSEPTISPEKTASPEAAEEAAKNLTAETEQEATQATIAGGKNLEEEIKEDDGAPNPDDPELSDIAGEKLSPAAQKIATEKLTNFFQQNWKEAEASFPELTAYLEANGIDFESEIFEQSLQERSELIFSGLTQQQIDAMNTDPEGFEFTLEIVKQLGAAIQQKEAQENQNQDAGGEGDETQNEAHEGPTEEEKQANREAIQKLPEELKVEDLIGENQDEARKFAAEAFLHFIKSPEKRAIINQLAQDFETVGPEEAKKVLKLSFVGFEGNAKRNERQFKRGKLEFEDEDFKMAEDFLKNAGEKVAAPGKLEITKEKHQGEFQGAIEAAARFLAAFQLAWEYVEKGDYEGAATIVRKTAEGEDAMDDIEQARKDYEKAFKKADSNDLRVLAEGTKGDKEKIDEAYNRIFNPESETGKEIPHKYMEEIQEASLAQLTINFGETINRVEEDSVYFGNLRMNISRKEEEGKWASTFDQSDANGNFSPINAKTPTVLTDPDGNPIEGFEPDPNEDLRTVLSNTGESLSTFAKRIIPEIKALNPPSTPQPEPTTEDNQPK